MSYYSYGRYAHQVVVIAWIHRMKSIVEKYGAGGEPVFNLDVPHVYRDLGKNFPKKLPTNVIVEKKRTGD